MLPAVSYHGVQDWQFDFTNWQPRVSATYAIGEKKDTLLRASYAQFADQLGFIGYYGSGVPIANGYYYYWDRPQRETTSCDRNEVRSRGGLFGSTTASTRHAPQRPELRSRTASRRRSRPR